jgi:hypothetical protein
MTAAVGAGAVGWDGVTGDDGFVVVAGGVVVTGTVVVPPDELLPLRFDDPDEPELEPLDPTGLPSADTCAANGSFDTKRWKFSSCPWSTLSGTEATRLLVSAAVVVVVGEPASVGAAREFGSVGAAVVVVVPSTAVVETTGGFGFPPIIFIVRGT